MANEKKKSSKKILSKLVTLVCLGVFIFAAHGLFNIFMDYYQNRQLLSDVQSTYHKPDSSSASAEEKKQDDQYHDSRETILPEFEELLKENSDVVGWITIDGTQIDYPVLQSSDNEFYLTKDYNNDESRAGSIFLDYRNDVAAPSRNTVVYGHRMKDGSMFQHLTKFLDEDFFNEHRTIEFDTLYDSYEAEIIAVYNTLTDFNYIETDFESDEEYEQLLADIKDVSKYETNVDVDADDHILTLSTCDYELDENEGRLVVQAKLVKK